MDDGIWVGAHDNHAIALMAAQVQFTSPLSDVALARILKAAAKVAAADDLVNSSPVQTFDFNPASQGFQATAEVGRIFSSTSSVPFIPGINIDFERQLHVDQTLLMFRTSRYSSWSNEREAVRRLFSPILDLALSVVGVAVVRLEYLDRFVFTGAPEKARAGTLFGENNDYVAPHVLQEPRLWHLHTGREIAPGDAQSRVVQFHADCVDVRAQPGAKSQRVVNLMTARDDRRPFFQLAEADVEPHLVFDIFDSQHNELKDVLTKTLVDDVRQRIGL